MIPHRARWALALAPLTLCLGCSFHARGPEDYRDDTAALLETKNPAIKSCYDGVLKADPSAKGMVAVKFKVAEDTGQIRDVSVVDAQTTAPTAVSQCVVRSVDGLVLTPPDAREGQATFYYDFAANPGGPKPAT